MNSNFSIFYQISPHVGGKLTSFVAVLAQNTCVWGCRPMLYYSKVNIILLERFMKPGWESWIDVYCNLAIFYKAYSGFGGKPTSYVAVLAQNTYVYDCRLLVSKYII